MIKQKTLSDPSSTVTIRQKQAKSWGKLNILKKSSLAALKKKIVIGTYFSSAYNSMR